MSDERIAAILAKRRAVSEAGRAVLAAAVSIDRDWDLPASSVDNLIAEMQWLSDSDLEAALLLAGHLKEAVTCVLIRRDTAKLTPTID